MSFWSHTYTIEKYLTESILMLLLQREEPSCCNLFSLGPPSSQILLEKKPGISFQTTTVCYIMTHLFTDAFK